MKVKTIIGAVTVALLALLLCFVVCRRAADTESPPEETAPAAISPTPTITPAPEFTAIETTEPAPTETPGPYADRPDIDISSWEYVIANHENVLDEGFVPELTELEGGNYFDSRAADALSAFIRAARDEGLSVILTSSYRSYATQQYLFNNKVAQYGNEEQAARIVARPGTSEHQTGLSADIVDKRYEYMNESLAETELSKWMKEHCAEYGFILRYPEDKQDITRIMFEPWHFRYVGEEAAAYIMGNNLCLEEFLDLYN